MVSAGVLKIDIAPESLNHIYLAGFSHNKPAAGVHKPIHARILCLDDARGPLVMVSVDLIGFPKSDLDRVRALCPEIPGDRIFIASTHTHAGPDTLGLWGKHLFGIPVTSGRNENHIDWMIRKIASGMTEVMRNPAPARIVLLPLDN